MYVILVGLNHKTAPIAVREKCAFSRIKLKAIYQQLLDSNIIDGSVVLITCNRTEIYAATHDVSAGLAALENLLKSCSGISGSGFTQYTYQLFSYHAVSHLFAVASGLDSMILGEHEILGQVKSAYQTALDLQTSNRVLNILFQKALHVGKKVRTETGINKYPVSVSSAAAALCKEIFDTIDSKNVLIVGAGDMAELAVKHLMANNLKSVIVSNRSFDRAVKMASEVNGRAVHIESIVEELVNADIVISCTAAPHPIIRNDNCGDFLRSRNGRDIVVIDIAVPRDVEPELGEISGVFLYDIDDLQNVVEANYKERLKAAHKARDITAREAVVIDSRLASFSMLPVINSLSCFAENVKQAELKKALHKLGDISEREEKIISSLAHSIVKKLLHSPFTTIKEKAAGNNVHLYADVIKELFNLNVDIEKHQKNAHSKTWNKGE